MERLLKAYLEESDLLHVHPWTYPNHRSACICVTHWLQSLAVYMLGPMPFDNMCVMITHYWHVWNWVCGTLERLPLIYTTMYSYND
jgi:hypothetical protein